jgi:hypothetical protein
MKESTVATAGQRAARVSPTALNLLRECERCFWLDHHGLARPRGPFPTITGGLDRVIKRYCAPYHERGVLPPLLKGLDGVLATVRVRPYLDPDTGLTLTGRLDECLEVPTGLFVPLDHKTRGSQPDGVHDAYQLQLDAYTLLLAESGHAIAGYGVLVYYVPVEGDLHDGFPFRVYVQKVDTDPEAIKLWLRRARAILELPDPPEAAPDCGYCRWAEDVGAYR